MTTHKNYSLKGFTPQIECSTDPIGVNSSDDLNRVDCVECLRAVAKSTTAKVAELDKKYARARYDRNRYWEQRNTARERANKLAAESAE